MTNRTSFGPAHPLKICIQLSNSAASLPHALRRRSRIADHRHAAFAILAKYLLLPLQGRDGISAQRSAALGGFFPNRLNGNITTP